MTDSNTVVEREDGGGRAGTPPHTGVASSVLLLRVVLDDELLLDRDVDLLTDRELVDQNSHAVRQRLHPARHDPLAVGLASHDERSRLEGLLLHVDHVVLADLVRRDVDLLAVDLEVAVHDELAGVAARAGEPGAVHHVVEPALEELQQVVTGLAGPPAGLGVVVVGLLLEHAVGEAGLLLLTKLKQVLALLDTPAAVLARRVGATLVSLVAADEVDTQAARLLRHGAGVTGHGYRNLLQVRWGRGSDATALGRPTSVVGRGRDVLDGADLEADRTQGPDRRLASPARGPYREGRLLYFVLPPPPTH